MFTQLQIVLAKLSLALISISLAANVPSTDIWDGYPFLKRICAVESNYSPDKEPRQRLPDGSILWGWQNGKIVKRDVGACQINTKIWLILAQSMNLDIINNQDDNIEFAKYLFDNYGWHPWVASKKNWDASNTIQ